MVLADSAADRRGRRSAPSWSTSSRCRRCRTGKRRPRTTSLLFDEAGTNQSMKFRAVLGDAAAAFRLRARIRARSGSAPSATRLCRWSRAVCWPPGTPRRAGSRSGRRAKVLFANRRILAKQMGLAEDAIDMVEQRRRRRLRRARRILSGRFSDPVRGAALRPSGEMDRGSPRAPDDHQSRPRGGLRGRDRLRARRHGPRPARPRLCRHRRLYAHQRRGRRAQHRAIHVGALSDPQYRPRRDAADDQQDAGRHLPGARTFRDRFLPRAAVRHGGARSRHRPGRIPPQESRARTATCPIRSPPSRRSKPRTSSTAATIRSRSTAASTRFGWADKAKLQGQAASTAAITAVGVGCFIEGGAAGPKESARLVLESRRHGDGLSWARRRVGQGLETVFAQIAADALEMPMDRIIACYHGSTAFVSDGYGAYHSRSIVMGGSAVLDAADQIARGDARRSGAPARLRRRRR